MIQLIADSSRPSVNIIFAGSLLSRGEGSGVRGLWRVGFATGDRRIQAAGWGFGDWRGAEDRNRQRTGIGRGFGDWRGADQELGGSGGSGGGNA